MRRLKVAIYFRKKWGIGWLHAWSAAGFEIKEDK